MTCRQECRQNQIHLIGDRLCLKKHFHIIESTTIQSQSFNQGLLQFFHNTKYNAVKSVQKLRDLAIVLKLRSIL